MACNAQTIIYHWCKDHPVVHVDGDKEYCVFHAPAEFKKHPITKKPLSTEDFNKFVANEIFTAKDRNNACDLSGTVFPGDFYYHGELPEIKLTSVIFNGDVGFSLVKFTGHADFRSTWFMKGAKFDYATFYHKADFTRAQFIKHANFLATTFEGMANFAASDFHFSAEFVGAAFTKAKFSSETFLNNTVVDFTHVSVRDSLSFSSVNLRNISLQGIDLDKCEFIACQWEDREGRNILRDEKQYVSFSDTLLMGTFQRIRFFLFASSQPYFFDKFALLEELYRNLKVKFKEKHDEYQVSKWHASEREMQRRKSSIFRNPFDWLLLNTYHLLCGYGENPAKAATVLLVFILVLSTALAFAGIKSSTTTIEIKCLSEMFNRDTFFNSVLSALQYAIFEKDPLYKPIATAGHYLSLLAKILIPGQATLLVLALRNRVRR